MKLNKFPMVSKYEFSSCLLIATAFIYTVLRAYYLPVTHDEAVTTLYHAYGSFSGIFFYQYVFHANNHLLNTLLIKIFINLFGLSEFVIRIPALIGHVLYLVGIYKILKLFLKDNLLLCGLTILIFNPFLLELFATARGYALGLGFSSIGIYYLLRYVKDQFSQKKFLHVSLGFIMFAFASMASFSFFYIYSTTLIWLMGYERKNKLNRTKLFLSVLPSLLFLIGTCLFPVITLTMHYVHEITDALEKVGFWENTVLSLIQATLYNQAYFLHGVVHVVGFFIIGVIITAGGLVTISLSSKKAILQHPTFALLRCVSAWLMICSVLVIISGGFGLGYANGRTASYFIPLFYLLFLLVFQCLILVGEQFSYVKKGAYILVILFSLISFTHFYNCANFEDFYLANYCKSTRDVMHYLIQLRKTGHLKGRLVSIGTHRIFTPMLNFYIVKYGVKWLRPLRYREDLWGDFDYYYLCAKNSRFLEKPEMIKDLMIVGQHYSGNHLKVLKVFQETGSYLAIPVK